jgi:hypothetical protein
MLMAGTARRASYRGADDPLIQREHEFVDANGLDEVAIEAGVGGEQSILLLAVAGRGDQRWVPAVLGKSCARSTLSSTTRMRTPGCDELLDARWRREHPAHLTDDSHRRPTGGRVVADLIKSRR